MTTADGKLCYHNEAFVHMFGDIGDELPATVFADQSVGREVFQAMMAGEHWGGEVRMHGADKKILDILLLLIPRQNCPRFRRKLPTHGLV